MTAIDLPSNGGSAGLADDAAAVRSALDEIGEPTVVVGHSYGGIAVSEGAAGSPHAVGLVYLAAFMLDVGESLLDAMQHQLPDWISARPGRRLAHRGAIGGGALRRLPAGASPPAPPLGCPGSPSRRSRRRRRPAAWQSLPSTYLICDEDRAVPPPAQEAMSARAGTVRRVAASHSPFLSRPDDVAEVVLQALGR